MLGNLAQELDVPMNHVIDAGPPLVFVSLPAAIGIFDILPQVRVSHSQQFGAGG